MLFHLYTWRCKNLGNTKKCKFSSPFLVVHWRTLLGSLKPWKAPVVDNVNRWRVAYESSYTLVSRGTHTCFIIGFVYLLCPTQQYPGICVKRRRQEEPSCCWSNETAGHFPMVANTSCGSGEWFINGTYDSSMTELSLSDGSLSFDKR